jgi:hypothetical protein
MPRAIVDEKKNFIYYMPAYNEAAQPLQPSNRATYFSTLYYNRPSITAALKANTCMCFTYNNPTNYYYKPHSALGNVGTISSAYQAQRKRI